MKKIHSITFEVSDGSTIGPMPWSRYPDGVELVEVPHISCDGRKASVRIMVRCEPEIGRQMHWVPLERLANLDISKLSEIDLAKLEAPFKEFERKTSGE